jgi:hypothetical protein
MGSLALSILAITILSVLSKQYDGSFTLRELQSLNCQYLTCFLPQHNHGRYSLAANVWVPHKAGSVRMSLLASHLASYELIPRLADRDNTAPFDNFPFDLSIDTAVISRQEGPFGTAAPTERNYYFYLCDADNHIAELLSQQPELSEVQVQLSLTLFDGEGRHLGSNELKLLPIVALFVALDCGLLAFLCRKVNRYNDENKDIDYPILSLLLTAAVTLFRALFLAAGLVVYWLSGYLLNYYFVACELSELATDSLVSAMFVLLMGGWGVRFTSVKAQVNKHLLAGYLLLLSRVLLRVIWMYSDLSKSKEISFTRSWRTPMDLLVGVLFLLWFQYSMNKTKLFEDGKLNGYFKVLAKIGGLYFFVRPLSIYVLVQSTGEDKDWLISCVSLLLEFIPTASLAVSLTHKNGIYSHYSLGASLELCVEEKGDLKHI